MLKVQRWSLFIWILMIVCFVITDVTAPPNYGPGDLHSQLFGITAVTGILAFMVMFLATVIISMRKWTKSPNGVTLTEAKHEVNATKPTSITVNPWFVMCMILIVILVFVIGRLSNQKPPNIIVNTPAQPAPQVQVVQPRPVIQIQPLEPPNVCCKQTCNSYTHTCTTQCTKQWVCF